MNADEIYVMNAEGSGQQRLTQNRLPDENPDWSPDGSSIAFDRQRLPDSPDDTRPYVMLMNPDGSNQRLLVKADSSEPSWSPDASKVVYIVGTGSDVFVVNANGTGKHPLYPGPQQGLCDCSAPASSRG